MTQAIQDVNDVDRHHSGNQVVEALHEDVTYPARPLRVLHVAHNDKANQAYYFKNIFDQIDRREIEPSVLTIGPAGDFTEELGRQGITAYALDCDSRRHYPGAVRALRRIIETEKIDILHSHTFDPSLIGYMASKMSGRRLIVTRHYSVALHIIEQRLKRKTYLYLERLIYQHASHVIAPSRMVREILIEREGVSPSKISVIPHPQTTERYDAATPESVAQVRLQLRMNDCLSLVYVARLDVGKGHRYLFEALAQLLKEGLDARLFLVGAGPAGEELESLVRELGITERVRFLGWRDDALTIMAAADVAVHPSLHEALPQTVIEAIMLERPLVATDVSGVRDVIGDEDYGMIVPPADSDALRVALKRIIGELDEARERARRGREFVLRYMNASRIAREHVDCYRKVAEMV
jgi:glycosyltransferase involved in cell wall biosynthesis